MPRMFLARFNAWLAATSVALALFAANCAAGIEVRYAGLESSDDGYAVSAQFDVELTPRLQEALNNGVALYFVVEFELVRPRWYWFDERSVASRLQYRLTYHALSRQYRLWTGTLHQPFGTLSEALRVLGRVRSWQVLERDRISNGSTYQAAVRMQLDTAQLPKPFQLTALTSRDWTLSSDWMRFAFTPVAPVVNSRGDEATPK